QGWKDSHDSVFHADGRVAKPPIALCEVQGYVYWAKRQAALLALALHKEDLAIRLAKGADALRDAFDEAFWSPAIGMYALALDGDKRRCSIRTSNAGHCLLTEIASAEHGRAVADQLMSDPFFSGWGVRTLASTETRYG